MHIIAFVTCHMYLEQKRSSSNKGNPSFIFDPALLFA